MIPKKHKFKRIRAGRIIDKKYMIWVSKQPCCVCGIDCTIQAHHPISNTARRKYGKAHDTETVPLCFHHHEKLHDVVGDEKEFERYHGVDFEKVGKQLRREYDGK